MKVNDTNEPQTYYHGSTTGIMEFGKQSKGNQIPFGVHFTRDKNIAIDFASGITKGKPTGNKGKLIEAIIQAKIPFDVSKDIYFEGTKIFDILKEIADKSDIKNVVRPYNKDIGYFVSKPTKTTKNAISVNEALSRKAKLDIIKNVLKSNGFDLAIKYSMRSTRDPLGLGTPIYTDAIAVLDKNLIKPNTKVDNPELLKEETKKSLELERTKLWNKAFKTFPRSPKQNEIIKKIDLINKKLGISETHAKTTIHIANRKVLPEVKPIPKELEPLVKEAKKYKTAEEFIKAQPVVYHQSQIGSKIGEFIQKGDKGYKKAYYSQAGEGIYFSPNKELVKSKYGKEGGKLVEAILKPKKTLDLGSNDAMYFNGKMINAGDIAVENFKRAQKGEKRLSEPDIELSSISKKAKEWLIKNGYDSVTGMKGKMWSAPETVVLDKSIIKTTSQLTDIFDQAKGIKTINANSKSKSSVPYVLIGLTILSYLRTKNAGK